MEEIDDADNAIDGVPNQYTPKRVTAMNGHVVDNVACGGCHTLLTATKGSNADFTNNDFNVVDEQTRQISLTELPPLQKVPVMSKPEEHSHVIEDITNSNVDVHNTDNVNGNVNEEVGSIDSLEANVSGSHIVNINDLENENGSTHDAADINTDAIDPTALNVKTKVMEAIESMDTMADKAESKVEEVLTGATDKVNEKMEAVEGLVKKAAVVAPIAHDEAKKVLDLPDKMLEIANSPPPKTPILPELLHVPDLSQISPGLSKHSDDGQKSEADHSENETIPCGSDKSSPQAGKTKTQAVMPIVRSEDHIDIPEDPDHPEECDVVVNKTPEKGRFARMFQTIRDKENSCMGKGKVIEEKVVGKIFLFSLNIFHFFIVLYKRHTHYLTKPLGRKFKPYVLIFGV